LSSGNGQLNPHHNNAGEMNESRLMMEPLAAFDQNGDVVPILAAAIPSVASATLDPKGSFAIWQLKKDVLWHDGRPFSADDVIFTWEYTADSASGTTTRANYTNVAPIDKLDELRVKINFKDPTPIWQLPFVGQFGTVLPKHIMEPFKGQKSREAPFNQRPIGTGPFKIVDFRSGDLVSVELFDKYHLPNRPFFDRVEFKSGGSEALTAARAVLQTGEFDFSYNLQFGIDKTTMTSLEQGGVGQTIKWAGISTEHLQLNPTDPNVEVDGERSSIKTKHPFFGDPQVRQAVALAVDRKLLADQFGPLGATPAVYMAFNHPRYMPDPTESKWAYDAARANQMMDAAGWAKGADGVRAKAGTRMRVLYQSAAGTAQQEMQAVIKKNLEAIGFEVELMAVPGNVFTAADPNNPDNYYHFYADIQGFSANLGSPDPQTHMSRWISSRIPQKVNNFGAGNNTARYQNAEFDQAYDQAQKELDPEKRAALFRRMNELVTNDAVIIPLFHRTGVSAANKKLVGPQLSPWDALDWNIAYWYRTP
jgi:peptide/nickel transport system substrate-binding protein